MEPSEALPPSSQTEGPTSFAPVSRVRLRTPIGEVLDELRELSPSELADVQRYAKRVRAVRGDRPSPELVSNVVATVGRLFTTYPDRVPISLVRAGLASVPRALIDQSLFDAEARHLLCIEPVQLPASFVEVGAGIQHERGLLYWIVPFPA